MLIVCSKGGVRMTDIKRINVNIPAWAHDYLRKNADYMNCSMTYVLTALIKKAIDEENSVKALNNLHMLEKNG